MLLQPHLADEPGQLPGHCAHDTRGIVHLRVICVGGLAVHTPLQDQYAGYRDRHEHDGI